MSKITKQEFSSSLVNEFDGKTDKDYVDTEIGKMEHLNFRVVKTGKDAEGVFTTVEYRRKADNTLAVKSVLSGGTSPNYTTRTMTYYAKNGTTVVKTEVYTLTYDADGDLISEV